MVVQLHGYGPRNTVEWILQVLGLASSEGGENGHWERLCCSVAGRSGGSMMVSHLPKGPFVVWSVF